MRTSIAKLVLASFTLFAIASCDEGAGERMEDTADTMGAAIESEFEDIQDDIEDYRDENFVENVLDENGELIYLLQMAGNKGTAGYVKDASGAMLKEHNEIQEKFSIYARTHAIDMDDEDYSDNLSTQERGDEWDREWNRKVSDKHEKLIRKFERKADNANDPELKQLAATYLPSLRNHLGTLGQYER